MQISMGMAAPDTAAMPKLSLVERGIRRVKSGEITRTRLPITPRILRQLKVLWSADAGSFDTIMIWAVCCVAFFGFFRMGEITSPSIRSFDDKRTLTVADVAADSQSNPTTIRLRLKVTKTSQFSAVDVYLGRTDDDLCPVAALLAYLTVRGMSPGPLFQFQDGRFLTKDLLIAKVRDGLDALGLDSKDYAGHSFRIGAATTAAEAGVEDSMIKTLGRWESSAYLLYVKIPRGVLAGMSKRLSRHAH